MAALTVTGRSILRCTSTTSSAPASARPNLGRPPATLEGDLEFLLRAALKVEAIREDLGKVGPVIASQVEEAMLGRRRTLDTARAERESEPVQSDAQVRAEAREQLEKLAQQLQDTERELRLSPANIQNVVETGLALAGQAEAPSCGEGGAFHVPALTGSWALCAERPLPIPIAGRSVRSCLITPCRRARRDVVLCHLNHRLVQMCLRLLRAEIWSQGQAKKLHRFTTRMVPDTVLRTPAVLIHGRLLVLGGDNHRVHEEIIVAGGHLREGRFSRMNVGETQAAAVAPATTARRPI